MLSVIKKGSQGEDVSYCQVLLNEHGINTSIDGVFGSGTEKSVKQFQSDNGLIADGIVGKSTWASLESKSETSVEVSMSQVSNLFSNFMTQTYQLSGAQCPSNPPGVSLKRIGTETTNCVLFTSWLLSAAFEGVRFTGDQWSKWMVSTSDDGSIPNWGPSVAVDWGTGSPQPGKGPWLVQWFTSSGGHSLIVLAENEDGKILTLEANDSIDGAGWNDIGPLREVLNPGPDWASKVTQTWTNRIYSKRAVHIASLNITGVQEWLESAE